MAPRRMLAWRVPMLLGLGLLGCAPQAAPSLGTALVLTPNQPPASLPVGPSVSGRLRLLGQAWAGASVHVASLVDGRILGDSVTSDADGAFRLPWPEGPGPYRVVASHQGQVLCALAFEAAPLVLDEVGTALAQASFGPLALASLVPENQAGQAFWGRLAAHGPALRQAMASAPEVAQGLAKAGEAQGGGCLREEALAAIWTKAQAQDALLDAVEALVQPHLGKLWSPSELAALPKPWLLAGTGLSLQQGAAGLVLQHPQVGALALVGAKQAELKAYMACVRQSCTQAAASPGPIGQATNNPGGGGGGGGGGGAVAPVPTPTPAATSNVRVRSYSPSVPVWGSWVDIDGAGFSSDPDQNEVRFGGGVLGRVLWASSTRLSVVLPPLAEGGRVSVSVSGGTPVQGPVMNPPSFPRFGRVQAGPNLLQAVEQGNLITTRAGVYLLGGVSGISATSATSLVPVDATGGLYPLRLGPQLQVARSAHLSVVSEERAYVFSGAGSSGRLPTEQAPLDALGELGAFSLADGAASPSDLPDPQHEHLNGHGFIAHRQLYLVGGGGGNGGQQVERMPLDAQGLPTGPFSDAQPDGLASLPSLPVPLFNVRCAVVGDFLFVMGSSVDNDPNLGNPVYLYAARIASDGALGPFQNRGPAPALALSRSNYASAAVGRSFIIVGGYNPSTFSATGELHEAQMMPDGTATYFQAVPGVNLSAVAQLGEATAVGHELFVAPGVLNGGQPLRTFRFPLD